MYTKTEVYSIVCDNCQDLFIDDRDSGQCYWEIADEARVEADEYGWHHDADNNKHYCPECHTINDNDELVIDMTRTKPKDWELKNQVATGMPASTSLKDCPFHYCDKNPKCENTCRYANPTGGNMAGRFLNKVEEKCLGYDRTT